MFLERAIASLRDAQPLLAARPPGVETPGYRQVVARATGLIDAKGRYAEQPAELERPSRIGWLPWRPVGKTAPNNHGFVSTIPKRCQGPPGWVKRREGERAGSGFGIGPAIHIGIAATASADPAASVA